MASLERQLATAQEEGAAQEDEAASRLERYRRDTEWLSAANRKIAAFASKVRFFFFYFVCFVSNRSEQFVWHAAA